MKKIFGILAVLLPVAACVTSIVVVPQALPEPVMYELGMTLKVVMWLLVALVIVITIAATIAGMVIAIGWALGQSKGDVKEMMGAAIALVRGSTSLNRLMGQRRRGQMYLPPPNSMGQSFEPEEQPTVQTFRVVGSEPWQEVGQEVDR